MRVSQLLPFAAATAALVIPDEKVLSSVAIEDRPPASSPADWSSSWSSAKAEAWTDVRSTLDESFDASKETLDRTLKSLAESVEGLADSLEDRVDDWARAGEVLADGGHHRPRRPHKPHQPPKKTVYELIAGSKYTSKLAGYISEYPDLVKALNSTSTNVTLFAPTNQAFEKIPKHAKPSKEFVAQVLSYHVVPGLYPAGRVLASHTVPTLLEGEHLSEHPSETPQRLSFHLSLRGLTVNFFSRVIAVDIVRLPLASSLPLSY